MRKLLLGFTFLLSICFLMTSCGKDECMTCTYDIDGQVTTTDEICGSSDQLDKSEDSIKEQAAASGAVSGKEVLVNCTRR